MPKLGSKKGSRGCPKCGDHRTEGFTEIANGVANRVYWCLVCRHRWHPCLAHCRGYRLEFTRELGPMIVGCPECGVPDRVARVWPEAYRAMADELRLRKQDQLAQPVPQ